MLGPGKMSPRKRWLHRGKEGEASSEAKGEEKHSSHARACAEALLQSASSQDRGTGTGFPSYLKKPKNK